MGKFLQEISHFRQQISSSDRDIILCLSGNDGSSIAFRGESYYDYTESELEKQLEGVLQRGWAVRRSARNRALSHAVGRKVQDRAPTSSQERKFREERSKLSGLGQTDYIEVVFSVNEAEWEVNISDGTIDELDHEQFLRELQEALAKAITDLRAQIVNLKDHIYYGHPLMEMDS